MCAVLILIVTVNGWRGSVDGSMIENSFIKAKTKAQREKNYNFPFKFTSSPHGKPDARVQNTVEGVLAIRFFPWASW
jgi:hypothetical protein